MQIEIRAYRPGDLSQMTAIWNHVVEEGNAFPQLNPLCFEEAAAFFGGQSFTGVAEWEGEIAGLYICLLYTSIDKNNKSKLNVSIYNPM